MQPLDWIRDEQWLEVDPYETDGDGAGVDCAVAVSLVGGVASVAAWVVGGAGVVQQAAA